MTVKPDPPPQVEMALAGFGSTAAIGSFQLFAAQTFRGSMDTSVSIWMEPLLNTWMTSPGFEPAGWPFVSTPAISTTLRPLKLPTQTSSLPSMFKPHGTSTLPPPVKPAGAGCVPSGRIMLIIPVGFGYLSAA